MDSETNAEDLRLTETVRRGELSVTFDPIFFGNEAVVCDTSPEVVGTAEVRSPPWRLRLPFGTYMVELPSLGLRKPVHLVPPQARVHVGWEFRGRWILVAGTGRPELPDAERWSGEAIGRVLAEAGFGLIGGGWPGVDAVVARSFAERMSLAGQPIEKLLLQVVAAGREETVNAGDILRVPEGDAEFEDAIERADAAILIGGLGGTLETGRRMLRIGKPVLPLPASGGDAKRLFDELSKSTGGQDHRHLLEQLHGPLDTKEQALALARALVRQLVVALTTEPDRTTAPEVTEASDMLGGDHEPDIAGKLSSLRQKEREEGRRQDRRNGCYLGEPFRHDLFVSYSHHDAWSQAFVRVLEIELRQHPKFSRVNIWDQRSDRGLDPTKIREQRVETLVHCDGLLLLGTEDAYALEADLVVVGRKDRHSARSRTDRLLPCAVLDTTGSRIGTSKPRAMADALGIHWIETAYEAWPAAVKSWLGEAGTVAERVR